MKVAGPDQIKIGNNVYDKNQVIASNITPNGPPVPLEEQPYSEIQTDAAPNDTIAQNFEYDGRPPTLIPGPEVGQAIQMGFEAAGKAPKAAIDGTINDLIENKKSPVFPYRGLEDSKLTECTKDNPKAWTDAMAAIPVLKQSGLTSDHLRAVIRNELHFYDPRDIQDDDNAKAGEKSTGTLGYAQITPKGITEFVRDVPEFKDFIKDKGYEVPDDENKILEDPGCVPMIVAAKMASLIKNYQMHNQKHPDNPVAINPRSLIYGYNADVQRVNQNGKITFESMTDREADFKRALKYDLQKVHPSSDPRILDASNHLRHVLQQLNAIQKSR